MSWRRLGTKNGERVGGERERDREGGEGRRERAREEEGERGKGVEGVEGEKGKERGGLISKSKEQMTKIEVSDPLR